MDPLSTLQSRGTLSAYDLSSLTNLPLGQVVATLRNDLWWETEALAWPSGFLYRIRPVISTTKRMAREVKEYINVGISPTGPKGYIT